MEHKIYISEKLVGLITRKEVENCWPYDHVIIERGGYKIIITQDDMYDVSVDYLEEDGEYPAISTMVEMEEEE